MPEDGQNVEKKPRSAVSARQPIWTRLSDHWMEILARPSPRLENGAQGRSRTTDTAIFSRMLYQLSYLGVPLRLAAAYRMG